MKKKLVIVGVMLMLLTITFSGCFEEKKETSNGRNIPVVHIQQLINNASIGDSIIIPVGTYIENVSINKSIILVGEDRGKTIIEGNVNIFADNVTLSNFTIKNGTGVTIIGYEMTGSTRHFYNNTITNNIITNSTSLGVYLEWAFNTKVTNNIIENNRDGIWLQYAGNNNIKDNYITNNSDKGISISFSSENTFYRNTIENNEYGIYFDFFGEKNNVTQNIIKSNSKYGLYTYNYSNDNNNIYTNNFINNTINAYDECNNTWYDTTSEVGNYWSDYEGKYPNATSSNGIWDTPYDISGGINQDRYPLMYKFYSFAINFLSVNFTYTPNNKIATETNIIFNASLNDTRLWGAYFDVWYEWDFGDGTSIIVENNPVSTHQYNASGIYSVKLFIIYHWSSGNITEGYIQKYLIVED